MRFLHLTLIAAFAASALPAASVPRMSFEQVVQGSPRAVHGVVVGSWSAWDESRSAIWTHYEVRVMETLRGPAQTTVTISEPGGAVGDIAMRVPGAPRLAVGEEAVLFAYPTPLGYWRIRGWGQGRFPVTEAEGRRVVRTGSSPEPWNVTQPAARAASLARPALEELPAFLDRVRALLREADAR